MSTRSYIGLLLDDGRVEAIYCHGDGYPSHNGFILNNFYCDIEKIKKLILLGDLSSLAEEIGEKHDFDRCPPNWCNAYSRDRGEESVESQSSAMRVIS